MLVSEAFHNIENNDWPLFIFILISICKYIKDVIWLLWQFTDEKSNVFTKSLLVTTIQDGGIRERSIGHSFTIFIDTIIRVCLSKS